MNIICISRGSFGGGKLLAESLAKKLACDCLSREELTEAATRSGIPVGRLETAVSRNRPFNEQMAVEKDCFKAFVTAALCERVAKNSVVYHGRTGHLVLSGIQSILRIRVIMDEESRIALTMQRLGLGREKARRYNHEVDEDRHRWARTLYNVDWADSTHYDLVLNLSRVTAENAAAALVGMAQLPEFQSTPATLRTLDELHRAARYRLALGQDVRTASANVKVQAKKNMVSVTYLPRDRSLADLFPKILHNLGETGTIVCTMASTSLLWIQERFHAQDDSTTEVLEIADRWNAAVEVVQLNDVTSSETSGPSTLPATVRTVPAPRVPTHVDGGILDDDGATARPLDPGLRATLDRLIAQDHAGGYTILNCDIKGLMRELDRTTPYGMVIVGEVFSTRGSAVKKRLSNELIGYLVDNLRIPVIEAKELKTKYLFGPTHWFKMLGFAAGSLLLVFLVLGHQEPILRFTIAEGTSHRLLVAAGLFCFAPLFAYLYGNFTQYLLRLFRFE